MNRERNVHLISLLVLILAVAGCGGGGAGPMLPEPPPDGWEEGVLAMRTELDEEFRTDPGTPIAPADRGSFESLDYWSPDETYRFVGEIHEHRPPEELTIITTTGKSRPSERYGWIEFEVGGESCTLQVYRLLDMDTADETKSLFLPFRDRTSGKETYPAGRYVPVEKTEDGRYVVDFNRAHNPYCAYGMPERYICPVTPAENRLEVRIEAGEKGYRRYE